MEFNEESEKIIERNLSRMMRGRGYIAETMMRGADYFPIKVQYDEKGDFDTGDSQIMVGFGDQGVLWKEEHYQDKTHRAFAVPEDFGSTLAELVVVETFKRFNEKLKQYRDKGE
ncbi:hypothetical protein KY343_02380 [Candidatus Woesearchaeota archaeon]|nr:hypothetical protein [Candidatus Woesearchaeota archaeon]